MITEKQYQSIAEQVYWVENKRNDVKYHPKEGMIYHYDLENEGIGKFKVLKVEDNLESGMQAMAVAPIVEGRVDTSHIVIAYAGTNFFDLNDIRTDIQSIGFGQTYLTISY